MQSSSQNVTTNKPTPSFLQAGCPSCHPTNSVRAMKGKAGPYVVTEISPLLLSSLLQSLRLTPRKISSAPCFPLPNLDFLTFKQITLNTMNKDAAAVVQCLKHRTSTSDPGFKSRCNQLMSHRWHLDYMVSSPNCSWASEKSNSIHRHWHSQDFVNEVHDIISRPHIMSKGLLHSPLV